MPVACILKEEQTLNSVMACLVETFRICQWSVYKPVLACFDQLRLAKECHVQDDSNGDNPSVPPCSKNMFKENYYQLAPSSRNTVLLSFPFLLPNKAWLIPLFCIQHLHVPQHSNAIVRLKCPRMLCFSNYFPAECEYHRAFKVPPNHKKYLFWFLLDKCSFLERFPKFLPG